MAEKRLGELLLLDVALESIPHLMKCLRSTKPAWEIAKKKKPRKLIVSLLLPFHYLVLKNYVRQYIVLSF